MDSAVFFLSLLWCTTATSSTCSVILYSSGDVNIGATSRNCSVHSENILAPYSYLNKAHNITIFNQVSLNNLFSVNELDGSVTLDFLYRLSWRDPRWDIPDLWPNLHDLLSIEGLNIDTYVRDSSNPLKLWLSDNVLPDTASSEILSEVIRLKPGGIIYWSRHIKATLAQPFFDYTKYPTDKQSIVIRVQSYGFSAAFVRQQWANPAMIYYQMKPTDTPNFMMNQLWTHSEGDFETSVYVSDQPTSYNGVSVHRIFDMGYLYVDITRQSDGIVIRLAMTILTLLVLSGLTFWASIENRLPTTMTLLLSVSALYIVVIGQIPLVGYMTIFDDFVRRMYFLLALCVALHQIVFRIYRKSKDSIFRELFVRLIEFCGRVFIFPFSVFSFLWFFAGSDYVQTYSSLLISVVTILVFFITVRESGGIIKSFRVAMIALDGRVKNGYSMSVVEVWLHTLYLHTKGPDNQSDGIELKSLEISRADNSSSNPSMTVAGPESAGGDETGESDWDGHTVAPEVPTDKEKSLGTRNPMI